VPSSSFVVSDTDPAAERIVDERVRAMSPRERSDMVAALSEACERMAEAGVRSRYPNADEGEVRLRMIALRLGRDLTVEVYGWDPDVEGW